MSNDWAELLMLDHQTTEKVLEAVSRTLTGPEAPSRDLVAAAMEYLAGYADKCHNRKEEDHLFPLIEARGIPRHGGPLAVMMQEHEQSRELLAELSAAARDYVEGRPAALAGFKAVFDQYSTLLKNHYWKENDILYPMARRVMTAADQSSVVDGILRTEEALGPATRDKYYSMAARIMEGGGIEDLSLGLHREVMAAILNTLPVELSFVDENDIVRYFSHENAAKIFPRTRGVIGMPVQQCHPQKSLHMVNAILADFKAGRRSVAEFWIDMAGKKIHIRYFPVRGPKNEYLGCLEVVQDITAIQQLQGERRLLDEGEAPK
ncbi:MAG: PAS domain-containing protein [Vicinamibacterales bacterium]